MQCVLFLLAPGDNRFECAAGAHPVHMLMWHCCSTVQLSRTQQYLHSLWSKRNNTVFAVVHTTSSARCVFIPASVHSQWLLSFMRVCRPGSLLSQHQGLTVICLGCRVLWLCFALLPRCVDGVQHFAGTSDTCLLSPAHAHAQWVTLLRCTKYSNRVSCSCCALACVSLALWVVLSVRFFFDGLSSDGLLSN
jgi:hypothetical protein